MSSIFSSFEPYAGKSSRGLTSVDRRAVWETTAPTGFETWRRDTLFQKTVYYFSTNAMTQAYTLKIIWWQVMKSLLKIDGRVT